ncbi:hypothetical protein ACFPRL_29075 [Pseudoclavibacter helvolus]
MAPVRLRSRCAALAWGSAPAWSRFSAMPPWRLPRRGHFRS